MLPYVLNPTDPLNTVFDKISTELNSISGLPADIKINQLDLEAPAMWFAPQGQGAPYNKDMSGNFWVDYPFIVYVRVNNNDTYAVSQCFNALDEIINKHFINSTNISLGGGRYSLKVIQTQGANIVNASDDGVVDYASTFLLTYIQTKEQIEDVS